MLAMMKEIMGESWTALARSRTRSLLTMLGIVWGIATVTLHGFAQNSSGSHCCRHGYERDSTHSLDEGRSTGTDPHLCL